MSESSDVAPEMAPFRSMKLRFGAGSLMPVPAGKWRRLPGGEIEATYTPKEWETARWVYDEVVRKHACLNRQTMMLD